MNWYLEVLKKYAVFSGRARRKEYWCFFLFSFIIGLLLISIDIATGNFNFITGTGLFSGIYTLAIFIPSIAVGVRRLHDTNKSGWWFLIIFIPVIGGLWLLITFLFDSFPEENKYGLNPKLVNKR